MFIPVSFVPQSEGREVRLHGWIERKRDQKALVFIILRDSSGTVQLACKGLAEATKATVESSIEVVGTVKKDARAPGGYEIEVHKLTIIGLAERWPITKDKSDEFLRDVRHLWIRSPKMTAMFKVRSEVFHALREFYKGRGFFEIQSPMFTTAGAEGGSTLFSVKYGDKKGVYLAQTWQLYAEAMIYGLERIFTIAPSFRAEKSRTIRHLSEYWHHEMEAAWMTYDELLTFEEELVTFVADHIMQHCSTELRELGQDPKKLELKRPFRRMTYADALKKLGKPDGYDMTDKDERELIEKEGGKPIFITHFERAMKAFYMKVDQKDPRFVMAADLLLPGVGEVIGGSERISDEAELLDSLKLFKLKKKDYEWYLDLRKYGTVPHSGFGLGVERLLMWLTGAPHIFDTIPFPRTMDRVAP